MNREDLSVGQPVVVFDSRGIGRDGEVTKIGRTLVTIKDKWKVVQFHIDTQRLNKSEFSAPYFKTRDQVDAGNRRDAAIKALHSHGFEIRYGYDRRISTVTLEKLVKLLEHPNREA